MVEIIKRFLARFQFRKFQKVQFPLYIPGGTAGAVRKLPTV